MSRRGRIVSLLDPGSHLLAQLSFAVAGRDLPEMARGQAPTEAAGPSYVAGLADVCAVLLLPLGLADGASLAIAREVHRQDVGVRTILFTGSLTATAETATPLFDVILSKTSHALPAILDEALSMAPPPRQPPEPIERQIAGLIRQEACFRSLRPSLPPLTPCRLRRFAEG